jgi:hypothetical protein
MMTTFLCLYHGASPASARLVALTADVDVVRQFAQRMTSGPEPTQDPDPVLRALDGGRRQALKLVAAENDDA